MNYPPAIQKLIDFFSELPSVGPKTAERYVFFLLRQAPEKLQRFAQSLAELREKSTVCAVCHAYDESSPCRICRDASRNQAQICIVASTRDRQIIESTREYRGQFHILGGLLDAINGIEPSSLEIASLSDRIKKSSYQEMILALSPNFEGETTALYLIKLFKNSNLKITRLARGLPTGAEIEYADQATLANALKYRNEL